MFKLVALIFLLANSKLFAEVVVVNADAECQLLVDGKVRGKLLPGRNIHLKLIAGEHHIEATPLAGGAKWIQSFTVDPSHHPRSVVVIRLSQQPHYWIDATTGLMWTEADNGSGLSRGEALRYCAELKSDGFTDWALPGIEQLQNLFSSATETAGFHVKAPLKLSGWQWSSSPGQQAGEGWAFDFGDGGRASVAPGDSGLNRALCVRLAN